MDNNARSRYELQQLIRKEKFDLILPIAMREHDIAMWIHLMQEGNPDPLAADLGGDHGYFIFTDRGEDRIERAVLGGYDDLPPLPELYDYFGDASELETFIAERSPANIAINVSQNLAVADGMSHSKYLELVEQIGGNYSRRLISAEKLITSFRVRRTASEIAVYAQLGEETRQLIERALSPECITPGKSTLADVGWWIADRLIEQGMRPTFPHAIPNIIHSQQSEPSATRSPDYIIQPGDLMQFDFGINHLNFGTDMKRVAYVLRKDESAVPSPIQYVWNQALKARDVIRPEIQVGRTAGITLEEIAKALSRSGFEYLHLTVDPALSPEPARKAAEIAKKTGRTVVTVDSHCVGNSGNSEVACGPSIAGFRPDRADIVIQPNYLFAFEFVAVTPIQGWLTESLRFNIEDNAVVTNLGVEWLYPPNERILLI